MHKTVTAVFSYALAITAIIVVGWLVLGGGVDEQRYLGLARSGLLLVGLFTMGWGAVTRSGELIRVGLTALALGWISFHAGEFIQRVMYHW